MFVSITGLKPKFLLRYFLKQLMHVPLVALTVGVEMSGLITKKNPLNRFVQTAGNSRS